MKPIRTTLCFFAALFLFCSPLVAQNQVMITVHLSPPYSHRFADYNQYQVQLFLSLTNTTQQELQMKVLGEINGQGTGLFIKTRPDYIPNQIITLAPGETRQFRGNELTGHFDRNNTEDNISDQLETDILRSGLLPQDVYEYCIQVVDINTLAELGRRCTFIPVQYLTPPQTNLPFCGDPYDLQIAPVINFSWLSPVGGGMGNANLRYDFYLLPVPEGQDPAQMLDLAMDGQPVGNVFIWPNIMGTSFQYNNLQLPPLMPGRYVWGVVAHDINRLVGIENGGKSQFCTIIIEEDAENNLAGENNGDAIFRVDCSCKSPAQPPGGAAANQLLQPGTDIQVGFYTMRVLSTDGNGNGSGRISMPGFPGGVSLPILVNFTGVDINGDRKMIAGMVRAQMKSDVGFLPEIADPQLATLPLGTSEIGQLDQYFVQNAGQLMSQIGNGLDASGFKLPLGLDKEVGGQQVVVAITGLQFDATRAAMDAAVVLNLVDAGTKIALSGRGICLKDGLGLCGEAELFLAENLELPAINMGLRGLQGAQNANQATRVRFDKDGFKNLHIEAFYRFPAQTLTKLEGGGQVEARLTADTDKGWSDWVATIGMDAFRINGVNDFAFHPGTAVYDHSSRLNPDNMPGDYAEGQSPTWMGFFLQTIQVDLPPIIKNRHTNQPLSASANNIIIDGNGVSGSLNLNNILAIGDGGTENWQFSVDRFTVKFLKNTFQSGGFEGHLLLPITSRGVQSQLIYSSLLSYTNGQFAYNFVVQPRRDLEVDLFAAMFVLAQNSNITISYSGEDGFEASARLSGEFSIGGKFVNDLPRIQLAEVHFQNLGLTTRSPFYTPGQIQASLGSPPKSVGGFPFNVTKWELVTIGLKATVDMQLSDHVGFLPNANTAFTIFGKFDGNTPTFDRFALNRIEIDADFSVLHVKGGLEFYSKNPVWGDGFQGAVDAVFPPGFAVKSRIQVGDKDGVDYWYVDGKTDFGGGDEDFTAGMEAFGFSGGGSYNMEMLNFRRENDITETVIPDGMALGATPSGINYRIKNGTSTLRASLVFGLGTKELFNVNGEMMITFSGGGVEKIMIGGDGRMFGSPGNTGMLNGGFNIEYDFPQKILALHIDMTMNFVVITGRGSLDTYSNGTNGDWHFKLGRPKTYGHPMSLTFDMGLPLKITASGYFQAGNFEVDGLPTVLPEVMMRLFPDYATRYGRTDRSRTQRGDAILLGISLEASFQQNYLIFYGRLRGAFGFDLLLQKVQGGCNGLDKVGMDGWYGNGQFYAGIEASIGIEVDLFFISGQFEILALGFGGLLTGGGPEPTWMKGEVGGFYSILGGLVEGHCSFDFSVGQICVPSNDPLAALKVINEIEPKPRSQADPQVDELQEIFLEPAASVNLRMGREFFLEETIRQGDNVVTKPRLFKFDREDLKVTMRVDKPNTTPIEVSLEYDADGYGMLVSPNQYLRPETDYIVTFTANVKECRTESITTYSSQNIEQQGYSILKSGTCNGGGWSVAKLANGQPFKEERLIKFKTNGGPMRLEPKQVIYSLPHHGQRFYCYGDFTQQAILAMDDDKERVMTADLFFRPDRANTTNPRLKLRLVPSGANADALDALEVEVMAGGIYDPSLDQGPFGQSNYYATKAQNYWIAPLLRSLAPGVTYGAQFFLEWDAPPAPENPDNPNMGRMATKMKQTVVARGMATITERELNLKKYRLKSNQREVYRYHFKASQYSSIERKLNDLKRNQLVYKRIRPNEELILSSEITAPTSLDWNLVAQRLQQIYPPEALNPPRDRNTGPQGVFLSKAGYDGPEKFDIFDVYGFEKTIGAKRYQVQPLISLDGDELINWWREQFNQAETILLQNGIREAYLPTPGINRAGWIFTEPKLKINGVMDSITTSGALGNGNPNMVSTLYSSNYQSFLTAPNQNSNLAQNIMAPSGNHLLEVRRDVERMMGTIPGAMPPGMNWLNNMVNGGGLGGWIGASDGPMNEQLMTNIGMSYDFVSTLQQPGISIPTIGTSGGGIQINAMQRAGAPRAGMINIGN